MSRTQLPSLLAAFALLFTVWTCTAPLELAPLACDATGDAPRGLLLTWRQDPTTTMTIDWHAQAKDEGAPELCFKKAGAAVWQAKLPADEAIFPATERPIFRSELSGLEPDTEYAFQLGGYKEIYRFRTMPESLSDRPVVFGAGGDVLIAPGLMEKTGKAVAAYDPDFIIWGGDLAYANGASDAGSVLKWEWFFEGIMNSLIDDDGRVIPILSAIGNHEVVDGYWADHPDYEPNDAFRRGIAPNFYAFFAFPGQPGYGVLDFGDYLTLIALDSDHTNPIDGTQRAWLEKVLADRRGRGVTHVVPFYHVPAYPSHRDFTGGTSTRVREQWVPLFEEYGVKMAFENHDHTYKRTHPIREGAVADGGIVYMGDGAWGVPTRGGDQKDAWYIAAFAAENHGIVVTLSAKGNDILAVSSSGEVLDKYDATLRNAN